MVLSFQLLLLNYLLLAKNDKPRTKNQKRQANFQNTDQLKSLLSISVLFTALLFGFFTQDVMAQKTINTFDEAKKLIGKQREKAQKKKKNKPPKKTGVVGNMYQDLTARFNRYFNADLRIKEGVLQLQTQHKDNYDDILPVYTYAGGDGTSISGDLDEAIKKASIALQRKPNSKWVDDSYLLIGKAYYLMGDQDQAAQSFQYVISKFDDNIRKTYDGNARSKASKAREKAKEKARKEREKSRDEERKEREKEREVARKELEKEKANAKKVKEKERADAQKVKEKERKEQEKARDQARKEKEKEQEQLRKEREKEREAAQKVKEKERKEKEKAQEAARKEKEEEQEQIRKEREKSKKELQKERDREKKEREKAKQQRLKDKAKNQKRKAKGKAPIKNNSASKSQVEKRKAEEAAKKAEEEAKRKAEEAEQQRKKEEEAKQKAEKEAKKKAEEAEKLAKEEEAAKRKAKAAADRKAEEAEKARLAEEEAQRKAEEEEEKIRLAEEEEARRQAEQEAEAGEIELEAEQEQNKKAKTKKGNSEKKYKGGGFLRHPLAKHEATVWLIRSYIDQKRFNEAETVLKLVREDKYFPKKLAGELNQLEAHYYLSQGNKVAAKNALEKAVKTTKKRDGRARLYYILAQLEAKDQNYKAAVRHYKKVLKSGPSFEMAFQAKMNTVRAKMSSGEFTPKQAIAFLEKMTKQDNNVEYLDQIYFALAGIAIESGDMELAQEYLSKSATESVANPEQKALSYVKLADLFYDQESFVQAGIYYDSALVALPKEFKNYETIKSRKEVLGELVKHIQTVELEDSLLRIAKMPKGVRDEYIEDLIATLQEEAEAKKQQEFLEAQNAEKGKKNDDGGIFYFYNQAAKSNGFTEFKQTWGERPLVDNWRLKSKFTGSGEEDELLAEEGKPITSRNDLLSLAEQGALTKEMILEGLPLTKEAQQKADSTIMEALHSIALIYDQKLQHPEKSVPAYERLLKRYPDNEYAPKSHYALYLLGGEMENEELAQTHKRLLLDRYPESVYAKLIDDINYVEKVNEKERELEAYYEETYALYQDEKYDLVAQRKKQVNELFAENPLQPKFDLLGAMVVGQRQDKTAYVSALKDVVEQHPEHEVKVKAEEMLKYLQSNKSTAKGKGKRSGAYNYLPESKHYFVVSFTGYTQQINNITNRISDFNKGNFSITKLKVNQMMLDPQNQIILVKDFKNAAAATTYFKSFRAKQFDIFEGLDVEFKFFVISKSNFTHYFKDKDVEKYLKFFRDNYEQF